MAVQLGQIESRDQKEHAEGKKTKINIAVTASFAGFQPQTMHRSPKGRKIVPPLKGFRKPKGDTGFGIQVPEGLEKILLSRFIWWIARKPTKRG